MSITEIPELPKEIKEAYERRRLVLFIGAGISRLVGVKGWGDLANDLVDHLYPYGEAQQIKSSEMRSKEKITVAYEKAKEDKQEDEYWKVFEAGIRPDPKLSVEDSIYRDISKITAIYLTTNCDGLLEQFLPTNVWTTDCKSENLNDAEPPYIFYIHGRYGNGEGKETLVFTVDQYLERYNNNLNNEYIGFLKNVFNMYTVLFLGYGANEFELLDYLVEKAGVDDQRSNNAYILEGFCGFEEPLCKAKRRYYNDLRINLIPYNKDKNGYKQQLNVIRAWVNQLLTTSTYSGDTIKGLMSFLDKKAGGAGLSRCLLLIVICRRSVPSAYVTAGFLERWIFQNPCAT